MIQFYITNQSNSRWVISSPRYPHNSMNILRTYYSSYYNYPVLCIRYIALKGNDKISSLMYELYGTKDTEVLYIRMNLFSDQIT